MNCADSAQNTITADKETTRRQSAPQHDYKVIERKMLRKSLLEWILKLCYFHSLLMGLCPAPFDWRRMEFRKSRTYLVYSLLVHCLSILITYPAYKHMMHYAATTPMLEISISGIYAGKLCTLTLIIIVTWLYRQAMMDVYCELMQRHQNNIKNDDSSQVVKERHNITKRIQMYFIWKFYFSVGNVVFLIVKGLCRNSYTDYLGYLIIITDIITYNFILAIFDQFIYVLLRLFRQFEFVNLELNGLMFQLNRSACEINSWNTNADLDHHWHLLSLRCSALAAMHFDLYRLIQRVFHLWQIPITAIMLRFLMVNITYVYQTLLMVHNVRYTNSPCVINVFLMTTTLYLTAFYLMSLIDGIQSAYNYTGQLLRQCTELLDANQSIVRTLEYFGDHLRCHRLKFMACGLFEINRKSCLRYFLTVVLQVIVMMQFDMQHAKSSQERNINY